MLTNYVLLTSSIYAYIKLCAVNTHAYMLTSSYVILISTLIFLHRVMCFKHPRLYAYIKLCAVNIHAYMLTSSYVL